MDQKVSHQLDPKLQEAYDRVMGVQVPAPTESKTSVAPANPVPVQPASAASSTVSIVQQPVASVDNASVTKNHTFVAKKGMKISPLFLVIGGVAFLLLYTIIWIKVFNLSVPFINQ